MCCFLTTVLLPEWFPTPSCGPRVIKGHILATKLPNAKIIQLYTSGCPSRRSAIYLFLTPVLPYFLQLAHRVTLSIGTHRKQFGMVSSQIKFLQWVYASIRFWWCIRSSDRWKRLTLLNHLFLLRNRTSTCPIYKMSMIKWSSKSMSLLLTIAILVSFITWTIESLIWSCDPFPMK